MMPKGKGMTPELSSRNGKLDIRHHFARTYLRDRSVNEVAGQDPLVDASSPADFTLELDTDELPDSTELHQNYPNPFNSETYRIFAKELRF